AKVEDGQVTEWWMFDFNEQHNPIYSQEKLRRFELTLHAVDWMRNNVSGYNSLLADILDMPAFELNNLNTDTFKALVDNIVWTAGRDENDNRIWWMFSGTGTPTELPVPEYSQQKLNNFKLTLRTVDWMINNVSQYNDLIADILDMPEFNLNNFDINTFKVLVDNIVWTKNIKTGKYWMFDTDSQGNAVYSEAKLNNFKLTLKVTNWMKDTFTARDNEFLQIIYGMQELNLRDLHLNTFKILADNIIWVGDVDEQGRVSEWWMFDLDAQGNPIYSQEKLNNYKNALPYVADLINEVNTRPEFAKALNHFYKFGILPGFSLNPDNQVNYQVRLERIGKLLFDIAIKTGREFDKAYPDIKTFVEIVVKAYELKDLISERLRQLGRYDFTFDSENIGFGYLIQGGIITLFIYDGVSLPNGLKQFNEAPITVTLVASNITLEEVRFRSSQDSDLIKQSDTIVKLSVRDGGDLSELYGINETGRIVGYYTPEGRLLFSEKDYYSTKPEFAGRLERQIRGNRETIYEYNSGYSYMDSRQFALIPVPSSGRTLIAGTNTILSEFTNEYLSGDNWVYKTVKYYDGNGKVARVENEKLDLVSGATWHKTDEDKDITLEYSAGVYEVLGMASDISVRDNESNLLQRLQFVDFSTNDNYEFGGAIYEGKNYVTGETYRKEVTDFLGRTRIIWNGLRETGNTPANINIYDYDREFENQFGAFGKATRIRTYLSDSMGNSTGVQISESELIAARGFNEFGGVDYLDTDKTTGIKKVSAYNSKGLLKESYEGELNRVYVRGQAIYSQIVNVYQYDNAIFSARNVSTKTETYIWNGYAQQKSGDALQYSVPDITPQEFTNGVLRIRTVNNNTGLTRYGEIVLDTGRWSYLEIPGYTYTEFKYATAQDMFAKLPSAAEVMAFNPETGDYSIKYRLTERNSVANGVQHLTSTVYYQGEAIKTEEEDRTLGIDYVLTQTTKAQGEEDIEITFEYYDDTQAKIDNLAWFAKTTIGGELFYEMNRVGGVNRENMTTQWQGKQYYYGEELRDVSRIQDYVTGATLTLETKQNDLRVIVDFSFVRDGKLQVIDMFVNLANTAATDFYNENNVRVKLERATRREALETKDGTKLVVWDVNRFYSGYSEDKPLKTITRKHQLFTGAYDSEEISMLGHKLNVTYQYENKDTINKFINLASRTSVAVDGVKYEEARRKDDIDVRNNRSNWDVTRYHRQGITRHYPSVERELTTGAAMRETVEGKEIFVSGPRATTTVTDYSYANLEDRLASLPSYFKSNASYGEAKYSTEESEGKRTGIDFANRATRWEVKYAYGRSTQSVVFQDMLTGAWLVNLDKSAIGTMKDAVRGKARITQEELGKVKERNKDAKSAYERYKERRRQHSSLNVPVNAPFADNNMELLLRSLNDTDNSLPILNNIPMLFAYDHAKARPGYTEQDVIDEANRLINSGDIDRFTTITMDNPVVVALLAYYKVADKPAREAKLRQIVNAGQLKQGYLKTAYGANVNGYIIIADNDNPYLATTLIHENNGGTNDENVEAEQLFSGLRGINLSYTLIGAGQKDMRLNSDVIPAELINALAVTGFNTTRTYFAPEDNLLAELAAKNFKVIVGFPFMDDRQFYVADILFEGYIRYVREHINNSEILWWELTNEANEQSWFNRDLAAGLRRINEAAANIKAIDSSRKISVTFSTRNIGEIARLVREGALSNVDIIGVNIYGGSVNMVGGLSEMFGKPVYIPEFGETSLSSEEDQAIGNIEMWETMQEFIRQGKIIGAFGFEAIDEWYKAGSYYEHDADREENYGYFRMQVRENADGTYTKFAIPKQTLVWQYLEWHPDKRDTDIPDELKAIELPEPQALDDSNHPFMHRLVVNTFGDSGVNPTEGASVDVFDRVSQRTMSSRGDFSDRAFNLSRESWTFFVVGDKKYVAEKATKISGIMNDAQFGEVTVWRVQQFEMPEISGEPAKLAKEFLRVTEFSTGATLWEITQQGNMRIKSVYDYTCYDASGELDYEKIMLQKYMRRASKSWNYYDKQGAQGKGLTSADAFSGDWQLYEEGNREDLIYMGETKWNVKKLASDEMFNFARITDVATGAVLSEESYQRNPATGDFRLIGSTTYDYDGRVFALFLNMAWSSESKYLDLDVFVNIPNIPAPKLVPFEKAKRTSGMVGGRTTWETTDLIENIKRTDIYNLLGLRLTRSFREWVIENHFGYNPTLPNSASVSYEGNLILEIKYPNETSVEGVLGSVANLPYRIRSDWATDRGMAIGDQTRLQREEVTQYFYSQDFPEGVLTNNWVDYRVSGDPFGRILVSDRSEHELYKSVTVNWDIRSSLRSYRVVLGDQISNVYDAMPMERMQEAIPSGVVNSYSEEYNRDIWSDLALIGITSNSQLRIVRDTPFFKGTDEVTGETYFSDIYHGKPTSEYLIPGDPLGRSVMTNRIVSESEKKLTFNQWWLEKDSVNRAPFGILPGIKSFKIKDYWLNRNRLFHLNWLSVEPGTEKTFEKYGREGNEEGFFYSVKNGNLKIQEFVTIYNRLYGETYEQKIAHPIRYFLPYQKRVIYDLSVPYLKPSDAYNEYGKPIAHLLKVKYDAQTGREDQYWSAANIWFGSDYWENGMVHINEYGKSVPALVPSVKSITTGAFFIILLVISVLIPILILLKEHFRDKKRWEKFVETQIKPNKGKPDIDPDVVEEAHERIRKILDVKTESSSPLSTPVGKKSVVCNDPTIQFFTHAEQVLKLIIQWLKTKDASEKERILSGFDEYLREASRIAGAEFSRGSKDSVYEAKGTSDPEIYAKLTAYFDNAFIVLRDALRRKDNGLFGKVLAEMGIINGAVNQEHMNNFFTLHGFKKLGNLRFGSIRRMLGLGTKSIHAFALFIASKYLRFLMLGLTSSVLLGLTHTMGLSFISQPFIILALVLIVITSIVEWNQLSRFRYLGMGKNAFLRLLRIALGLTFALFAYLVVVNLPAAITTGAFLFKTILFTIFALEAYGYLFWKHSVIALSIYRDWRPTIGPGRNRTIGMIIAHNVIFNALGLLMFWVGMPWFIDHVASGLITRLIGANLTTLLILTTMHYGIWSLIQYLTGIIFGPMKRVKIDEDKIKGFLRDGKKILLNYVGHFLANDGAGTDTESIIRALNWLLENDDLGAEVALKQLREWAAIKLGLQANMKDEDFWKLIEECLKLLAEREKASGIDLCILDQIEDDKIPENCKIKLDEEFDEETKKAQKEKLKIAFFVKTFFFIKVGGVKPLGGGAGSFDVLVNIMAMLKEIRAQGWGNNFCFIPTSNWQKLFKKGKEVPPQFANYMKMMKLVDYLLGNDNSSSYFIHTFTVFAAKSGAMVSMETLPHKIVKNFKILAIMDRNSNCLDLPAFIRDLKRMMSNDNLILTTSSRNTSNRLMHMGRMSWLVEGGHGYSMWSLNDKLCSGWGNFERMMDQGPEGYLTAMLNYMFPVMPITIDAQTIYNFSEYADWYRYGIIGLGPHLPHPSEDTADIWAQTHNAIGLGQRPEFALSEAIWSKLREWLSPGEEGSATVRWSEGLTNMLSDFILQNIGELGPESWFEKEARRNVQDFYAIMPLALLNIIFIPVGIILDILPFVGISFIFLIIGTLFNQIAALNGLGATAKAMSGIKTWKAFVGMTVAALLAFVVGASWPTIIIFAFFGLVLTNSWMATARWFSERPGDILLFAHRFAIETLAQIRSYKGVPWIFVTSGAIAGYDNCNVLKEYWVVKKDTSMGEPTKADWMRSIILPIVGAIFGLAAGIAITMKFGAVAPIVSIMIPICLTLGLLIGSSSIPGRIPFIGKFMKGGYLNILRGEVILGVFISSITIFAFAVGLDFTNAICLFISYFFGISMVIGPFLVGAKPGKRIWKGWGDAVVGVAGMFLGGVLLYILRGAIITGISTKLLSVLIANFAIFLGPVAIAAIIMLFVVSKIKDKVLSRITWIFFRFFIITMFAFLIFVIVPTPDLFVFIPAPGIVEEISMNALGNIGLVVGGLIVVFIAIGKIIELKTANKLKEEYIALIKDYASKENDMPVKDNPDRNTLQAFFHNILIRFGDGSYEYARQSLDAAAVYILRYTTALNLDFINKYEKNKDKMSDRDRVRFNSFMHKALIYFNAGKHAELKQALQEVKKILDIVEIKAATQSIEITDAMLNDSDRTVKRAAKAKKRELLDKEKKKSSSPLTNQSKENRNDSTNSSPIRANDRNNFTSSSPTVDLRVKTQVLLDFLTQRDVAQMSAKALFERFGIQSADILLILGSSRLEVIEEAARIHKQGLTRRILIAGGIGRETELLRENIQRSQYADKIAGLQEKSEAEIYRDILYLYGIPEEDFVAIDTTSTNSEENIRNTLALLEGSNEAVRSIVVLQHPALQRRAMATFDKIINEAENRKWQKLTLISFTPQISNIAAMEEKEFRYMLAMAIGEVYRLHPDVYGPQGRGFLVYVNIPQQVEEAYRVLKQEVQSSSPFDKGLVSERNSARGWPITGGASSPIEAGRQNHRERRIITADYANEFISSSSSPITNNNLTNRFLPVVLNSTVAEDFKAINNNPEAAIGTTPASRLNRTASSSLDFEKTSVISSSPLVISASSYTNDKSWLIATQALLVSLVSQYGEGIFDHLDELNEHPQLSNLVSLAGTPGNDAVLRGQVDEAARIAFRRSLYGGEWAVLIPAGGDATRLGLGVPKILLDIRHLLSLESEKDLEAAFQKALDKKEIKPEQIEVIRGLRANRDQLCNITILARILKQKSYSLGLQARARQTFILCCTEGDEEKIAQELIQNEYFGFNRACFIIQPQGKNPVFLPTLATRQAVSIAPGIFKAGGNGVPLLETTLIGKGYIIAKDRTLRQLDISSLEYARKRGVKFVSQCTIGDLRPWGQDPWNEDFLAMVYPQFANGQLYAAGEYVKQNPEHIQKGGTVLYNPFTGKVVFVESLAMKRILATVKFENQPLATFNHAFVLDALQNVSTYNIPVYIREGNRDSQGRRTLFTELVGGDIILTVLQNAGYPIAHMERPITIHELKGTASLIPTIEAALKQDAKARQSSSPVSDDKSSEQVRPLILSHTIDEQWNISKISEDEFEATVEFFSGAILIGKGNLNLDRAAASIHTCWLESYLTGGKLLTEFVARIYLRAYQISQWLQFNTKYAHGYYFLSLTEEIELDYGNPTIGRLVPIYTAVFRQLGLEKKKLAGKPQLTGFYGDRYNEHLGLLDAVVNNIETNWLDWFYRDRIIAVLGQDGLKDFRREEVSALVANNLRESEIRLREKISDLQPNMPDTRRSSSPLVISASSYTNDKSWLIATQALLVSLVSQYGEGIFDHLD
ncbi:MAG: ElyC/SanA/YdcF family protein, partial [Candidatus Omnitrophica bacterium]|nr:ElyC/SanA/YdcF family protein [Candidatus Omnitrophota bacterium]